MTGPGKLATAAHYHEGADLITVQLSTGAVLSFNPAVCNELQALSTTGLATVQVSEDGAGIEFLDGGIDIYLPELIEGESVGITSVRDRLTAITAQMELVVGGDKKHPLWHSIQELKNCLGLQIYA